MSPHDLPTSFLLTEERGDMLRTFMCGACKKRMHKRRQEEREETDDIIVLGLRRKNVGVL
jgi:uncharacterized protein YlaI